MDAAGNLWATLPGASPDFVAVGSHIDSVPDGGWLDGALGVLAGLEMLRSRAGSELPVSLRLVDFADEEGARFGSSLIGSTAAAGQLSPTAELAAAALACGVDLARANDARAQLDGALAYLELHIEQGPVLERLGLQTAAVDGCAGVERYRVTVRGEAAHGGAAPMTMRHDALVAASRAILEVAELAGTVGGTATVGRIEAKPGVVTIVPGSVELVLDLRHPSAEGLAALLTGARSAFGAGAEWELIWQIEPIRFDPELVELAREGGHVMTSGALHDAASIAPLVPTVMVFVPSIRGISHSREEDTAEERHRRGRGGTRPPARPDHRIARMSDETVKYLLPESEIPTHWVNLLPDLPGDPLPPLNPGTMQPAGPEDLTPIFPMGLIQQEVSMEPEIEIPDAVRDAYRIYRPSPLYRARRLERALDTPAHIYFKYEGVSPAGSHKPNSAIPQAYENKQAGINSLSTETGAGQWGSALALACSLFDMKCEVFMVGASYDQKPYRRAMMEAWGATVHRSPSRPDRRGPLAGVAPDRARSGSRSRRRWRWRRRTRRPNYALGSVLNHVCLHQTVIGQEAMAQMAMAGEEPDVVVGCVGGGSNFAGLSFPFVRRVLRGEAKTRFLAAEPAACPTLTRGAYRYDFGDTVGMTPLLPMYTLGHDFVPPPVHAGGLRYHGDAPMLCGLVHHGVVEARAYRQNDAFAAAIQFSRTEGIIPGPEPAHAIRATIEEAHGRARGRRAARDPARPLGPRPLRHVRLRRLPVRARSRTSSSRRQEMDAALERLPDAPALA